MKYDLEEGIQVLRKYLLDEQLIIFVGSGISIPSGLPDWDGFLDEFIDMAESLPLQEDEDRSELNELITSAKETGFKNRIHVTTVIKRKIKECELSDNALANYNFNKWLIKLTDKEPNDRHRNIIKTNYPYILTTNYDMLIEAAAREVGALNLASHSFTYHDGSKIMSFIHRNKSCVIHIHGSVGINLALEDIIFTKEDYNQIIRNKFEGFSFALRMLFTRYSTLFVGYGASDPHLEDIAEELAEYYPLVDEKRYPMPRSFLVTTQDKYSYLFEKWKDRLRTDIIIIKDYEEYDFLLNELKKTAPRRDLTNSIQTTLKF